LATCVLRRFRLKPIRDDRLVHAGFWTGFVPSGIPVTVKPK
jgi:hypothetical protein